MQSSDLSSRGNHILLAGANGTGKSTQALTLRGKKFGYLFGHNAIPIFRQLSNCEVQTYFPKPGTLDIFAHSVKKEGRVKAAKKTTKGYPDVYDAFAEDFDNKLSTDFFSDIDWLILDDYTGLYGLNFDAVSSLQADAVSLDNRNDYQIAGNIISNISRLLWTVPCNVLAMAHLELRQDDKSKVLEEMLFLPGAARVRVPHNFDSLMTEVSYDDKGVPTYTISSVKDKKHKFIRCSFDMAPKEDVTLDVNKPLIGQGIQGILDDHFRART